jgi:signal transduction histidine kinase/DNA-binding response OmpR family regulator
VISRLIAAWHREWPFAVARVRGGRLYLSALILDVRPTRAEQASEVVVTRGDGGSTDAVLAGGGELGRRMRAIDWARTPLGPVESWPQSLRTCVRIVLTSRQPMFVWWGEQLINLYNDAYISILGGKHPDALGQPASQVWREIWDDVGPRAAKAMRENEGTFDEALLLIMERNGYREETYYTFSYSPVPGDTGGPGGILCANSSDTQRIFGERQQALLREVAARTSSAHAVETACELALATFAIDRKDLPFAMLYIVDGASARLMCTAGIAREHPEVPDAITAETSCAWSVAEVLAGAPIGICRLAGRDLPCGPWPEPPGEAVAIPVRAADLSLAAVLVIGRNPFRLLDDDYRRFLDLLAIQIGNAITNARTFEEERRRAEALAELDRAKTAFFSNISHEFRTPLTLMLGPTEDALRSPGRALSDDALEAVHRNELRLLKLVNALLDFSRIEAGRLRASYEPTHLARFTRELASAFRSAMERVGLMFDVECSGASTVNVDRTMWEKIVLNLLSNALKFTFDGRVTLRMVQHDGFAELLVADTGIGIPEHELPRLFERFHRIEGARSRTHEGSGIGLALTAELVKLHGGTIDVASAVDRGTTFTVRIPTVEAQPEPGDRGAPLGVSTGVTAFVEEAMRWVPGDEPAPIPSRGLDASSVAIPADIADAYIIVADDNADMRDYLRRLLGGRWQVNVVSDGALALEAARQARPDLILTDVMMPNLDGFGLLQALRADPGLTTVPVIMLSARAGEEARIEGIEAGADDYLIKPFSARELLARVSNMLQLTRLRRDVDLERKRLASFIEQTPVGVVVWEGPELRVGLTNEAYLRMARRPVRRGVPLLELFPEIAGTETLHRIQRVYRDGEPADVTEDPVELRLPDGTIHHGYYSTAYRPLLDGHGATIGVIAVSIEVTEQVHARKAVEDSRTEAILANRAKDEFLAMLGHELRNPLAPILTALELMRLRAPDAVARERSVIERQTQHLAALVEDLLDVSRIARGMVELKRARLRLADIVAKAVETAAPLFEQQRHELVTHVSRDLVVDGDPARLTQVFANLLTNAAKYTDPGGRVEVVAERDGDDIVTRVTDTGRGIASDMIGRVFELFVQERQHLDRSRGGLGLGLAIVRNLVELHGGRVEVASPGPGRGSTFTVRLPRDVHATPEAEASRETRPRPDRAPDPGAISVLVVDDNVDAAVLLAELLASRGYTTHIAHDAPAALQLAHDLAPDVALLDIGLPAMDGYELARRLRDLPSWRSVKLLALTGYGQNMDRARSREVGFDDHLIKPIDLPTLEKFLPRSRRN